MIQELEDAVLEKENIKIVKKKNLVAVCQILILPY